MTTQEILKLRLHNQLLAGSTMNEPHEIVAYMGAMQSQAFEMAKWGIGVRTRGATVRDVEAEINAGKIVRTHILRPTWHFVAADDIHWMMELSAPRIRPAFTGYGKQLGFDEALIAPAIRTVERLLEGGNHLTRQEIGQVLVAENILADHRLASYIMGRAEIEGVVCSGRMSGRNPTYALLHEWVPQTQNLCREEALERLARKFFTSHGPATLQDFVWWSGLTMGDARKAIALISHDFVSEEANGRMFWMRSDIALPTSEADSALLLPPFDEFVVSYKERGEMIDERHYGRVMTKNGLFSPTAMLNGKIVGSWKVEKSGAEISFFNPPTKKTEALFKKAAMDFSAFSR